MSNVLMITGDRALIEGRQGAFYSTLQEFHVHWERVDIVCPGSRLSFSKEKNKTFFDNVFITSSPWPLWLHPLWIRRKASELFKTNNFDLIVVHEYPPFLNGLGAWLTWLKLKVPYILEIHHIPGYPKAGSMKEAFYRIWAELFIAIDIRGARAVRVVNQKQVPQFLIYAGVNKSKLRYIPSLYIDLSLFRVKPIEKKYDLVFAARLEKNKGIILLLEALKIAKINKPDVTLLIVGDGRLKQTLLDYIERNNLKDNVVFSGWLPSPVDVCDAYNSARVFVNPSFNEGGPRVAIEAMACGLPLISTRVGVMPDLIHDGQNGFLVDWNPHDLASKILALLINPDLAKSFSEASIVIAQNFERKKMIENYANELKKLIF